MDTVTSTEERDTVALCIGILMYAKIYTMGYRILWLKGGGVYTYLWATWKRNIASMLNACSVNLIKDCNKSNFMIHSWVAKDDKWVIAWPLRPLRGRLRDHKTLLLCVGVSWALCGRNWVVSVLCMQDDVRRRNTIKGRRAWNYGLNLNILSLMCVWIIKEFNNLAVVYICLTTESMLKYV